MDHELSRLIDALNAVGGDPALGALRLWLRTRSS